VETFVQRCAGLDVHNDTVAATVRVPTGDRARQQQTRTFGTTTGQLVALADWLASHDVTLVGMESTGVYWKPISYLLEEQFDCWLLNAHHLHHVPGRKTDVTDSAWIAQLLEHGLVRPSFVPPRPIRELRDLTRYRRAEMEERTREAQRLDKVLQDAGIKLSSVASRTLGASGRAMLDALVAGTRDPQVLADLARGRLRAKLPQLQAALQGRFRSQHHGLLVAHILAHIDYLDAAIAALSERIEQVIAPFDHQVQLAMTIPGIGRRTAESLVAECGADMSRFPSHQHLASWAGVCPGNNESAGKRKSGKTRKGSKWLRAALTEAAKSIVRSKRTYFAAHYAQIKGRRGHAKATGAVRHDILVAYYHVIRDDVEFRELGADYLAQRRSPEHRARRLVRQLERLGHKVTLQPLPQAAA
jgi:transposase